MDETSGHVKTASSTIKLLGWITFIPLIILTAIQSLAFISIDGYYTSGLFARHVTSALIATLLLFFFIVLANNIKKNKKWAKVVGAILGVLYLFAFPIGTVIGGILIFSIYKCWNTTSTENSIETID